MCTEVRVRLICMNIIPITLLSVVAAVVIVDFLLNPFLNTRKKQGVN